MAEIQLLNKLNEVHQTCTAVKTKLESVTEDIAEIKGKINDLAEENNELKLKFTALENDGSSENFEHRITQLETRQNAIREEINVLTIAVAVLRKESGDHKSRRGIFFDVAIKIISAIISLITLIVLSYFGINR